MTPTYTTAATTQQKAFTFADLERAMETINNLTPEPIGEWMRKHGCPPEKWKVVFPHSFFDETVDMPTFYPDYVTFSELTDSPVFVARDAMEINLMPPLCFGPYDPEDDGK